MAVATASVLTSASRGRAAERSTALAASGSHPLPGKETVWGAGGDTLSAQVYAVTEEGTASPQRIIAAVEAAGDTLLYRHDELLTLFLFGFEDMVYFRVGEGVKEAERQVFKLFLNGPDTETVSDVTR